MIAKKDQREFIGQIIDIIECFKASEFDDPYEVYIEGEAYDKLAAELTNMMVNWQLFSAKRDLAVLENIGEIYSLFHKLARKNMVLYEDPNSHELVYNLFLSNLEDWANEFTALQVEACEFDKETELFTEDKLKEKGWLRQKEE